ncbi:Na/Pi cotransporter family protein [Sedimenticola selenatireducens]|uniref:Na/Pi cotransporter family protein n=1 Tax=Sedimenticola selenatireducens TaxID=191960 RepID=A0A558E0J3_9GAMM|nr:Na/Pi symporter [Sedimenticola selenatireducens]TVO75263.1 Na/Pi cotransporter family protein [Sedimenticola selenatireducens]TVT66884.1 MAG: Na/Pi cotransporter family protein [Sedimenticola selenatireducens]
MLKKILLPTICFILAYGFWLSDDFKEISAGVAIFMFGMLSLEQGFRTFTGGILEKLINKTTSSLWKSLSFGMISTSILQSSSLVSVITISFLSAGLLTLMGGIGIIFGANLGTTTGAWLIAGLGLKIKISAYAMPMLVFGVLLIFQKSKNLNGIGYILVGLGFLFLGIHYMKEGFEAFKETINLAAYAVEGFSGLLLFTLIGALATFVMQSSHATLVLIITALAAQQITYENALALAIGANVGTTITAILGSISANAQGKRLAAAHLAFNLVTGLIAILFIKQLLITVDEISLLTGIREDDYTLKLALFHTLFNIIGVVVMTPLIKPLVQLLERLFKEKKPEIDQPKYLTDSAIDFPETAAKAVLEESLHVYDNAQSILIHALGYKRPEILSTLDLLEVAEEQKKLTRLDIDAAYARSIKGLYSAIVAFISRADFSWQVEQSADLHHLREANQHVVESIKDMKHLQKNMIRYINADDTAMRYAYDQLRSQLAVIIRQLEEIRLTDESDTAILSLDALKLMVKETHESFYLTLNEMMRKGRISPEKGTSLMNDSNYTYSIAMNLIRAAQTLFVTGPKDMAQAVRTIALDDNELQAVSDHHQALESNESISNSIHQEHSRNET